ncbi:MAG: hypothetical protein HDT48_01245 [Ruminococcaceae bacterium]|nr:hypothetical protein [Oscillospiraceae bacterium]
MFGPNTYFDNQVNICYSHRDKVFFDLFGEVRKRFSDTFNLNEYDILFVPGSGTIGVESVMYSFKHRIKVIGVDGTFKKRWTEFSKNRPAQKNRNMTFEMFCLLETSCSKNYCKEGCIVDAISGFPYYDIPSKTVAFITCLNKQLGSYVGLSVVGVRKNKWNLFIDEGVMSYLNLARYKSYHSINQAPSTSPTFIYEHFNEVLKSFDLDAFRKRLDTVSEMIVNTVGEENIIGNKKGPVITLKNGVVPDELARKYDIYGYWAGRPNYQMFTYTQKVDEYGKFLKELKEYGGVRV